MKQVFNLISLSIILFGVGCSAQNGQENQIPTSNENNLTVEEKETPVNTTPDEVEPKTPSPSQENSSEPKDGFVNATVTRIVDGDTVKVDINGEEDTLRLLLVDTPETVAPNTPVQPFGKEASDFAKKTLTGQEVQLEFDGPKRDKYDRLLVYLWIGDQMFNEMLLEGGYARLAYVYDPPYTHFDAYMKAQNHALDQKLRIWSIEGYVTEDGFSEGFGESSDHSQDTNSSSNKETEPDEEVYYSKCAEAHEAGVTPLYKGDPGYGTHLDGDGDGIACE
ncbi:thermonuclease family protein [Bacillaceae bacterium S4-13-58]